MFYRFQNKVRSVFLGLSLCDLHRFFLQRLNNPFLTPSSSELYSKASMTSGCSTVLCRIASGQGGGFFRSKENCLKHSVLVSFMLQEIAEVCHLGRRDSQLRFERSYVLWRQQPLWEYVKSTHISKAGKRRGSVDHEAIVNRASLHFIDSFNSPKALPFPQQLDSCYDVSFLIKQPQQDTLQFTTSL